MSSSRKTLVKKVKTKAQLFARLRDCNGRTGGASCISCGRYFPFAELDGGHWIRATHSACAYDERNINAQCRRCNRFEDGAQHRYMIGMVKKYGQDVVDELLSLEFVSRKWTIPELEELDKYYNIKIRAFK
jgi:hypothetical protein